MTNLRTGDVVALFDGTVRPPKTKRLLCVAVGQGWFLRINSNPHFRPHCPIGVQDNPGCLDHDSFVELRGILDWDMAELADQLASQEAQILGRIGAQTARSLAQAVAAAPTLRADEIEVIVALLLGIAGPS